MTAILFKLFFVLVSAHAEVPQEQILVLDNSTRKNFAIVADAGLIAEIWGGKVLVPLYDKLAFSASYKQATNQSTLFRTDIKEYGLWATYFFRSYHNSGLAAGLFVANMEIRNTTYDNQTAYSGQEQIWIPGAFLEYNIWALDWLSFSLGFSAGFPIPSRPLKLEAGNGTSIERDITGSGTVSPNMIATASIWF
jgi:hypothetical protein